jgi:hypothetical protein
LHLFFVAPQATYSARMCRLPNLHCTSSSGNGSIITAVEIAIGSAFITRN